MIHRTRASAAALAAAVVLLVGGAPMFGQATSPVSKATSAKEASSGKSWTATRTPDGKPDLQGYWSNATVTPLERPKGLGAKEFYTDEEISKLTKRVRQGDAGEEAELGAARDNPLRYDIGIYGGFDPNKASFASNKRTSLIVGPEGTVPPMLPEARNRNAALNAKNKDHEFDSYENRPLSERCILMNQQRIPMMPGAGEGNILQIVQGPGWVAFYHEIDHDIRVIPTDGRPHAPQSVRQWQGDSVGHWEGDTLVVDTTNFTGLTRFRGSGEKLHLIERFTRTGADSLNYRFTVEDPSTWDKPWTAEVPWTGTQGPIYEWACHEGNTMISTILKGARLADDEAAKKAK